jgi:predicted extracellular nuclease
MRARMPSTPPPPRPFSVATFNLLDFFLPKPHHAQRFEQKLAWTADTIARLDADAIGLQEVGEVEALDRLVFKLNERFDDPSRHYASIAGTTDKRGIRCALLTRLPTFASRVHVTDQLPFPIFREGDAFPFPARLPLRRGVVHAEVVTPLGVVHVLVVHFKSGRAVPIERVNGEPVAWRTARARGEGDLRALVLRSAEALFLRGIIDDVVEVDAGARVVVLGDFNDVETSTPVKIARGVGFPGALSTVSGHVAEPDRYSHRYKDHRTLIDHVLLSDALASRVSRVSIDNAWLRQHESHGDDDAPSIDSDHAPVRVEFA